MAPMARWPTESVIDPGSASTATAALRAGQSYTRAAGVEHNVVNAGPGPLSFVETEVKAFPG